jgi:hypothetical protein
MAEGSGSLRAGELHKAKDLLMIWLPAGKKRTVLRTCAVQAPSSRRPRSSVPLHTHPASRTCVTSPHMSKIDRSAFSSAATVKFPTYTVRTSICRLRQRRSSLSIRRLAVNREHAYILTQHPECASYRVLRCLKTLCNDIVRISRATLRQCCPVEAQSSATD